MSAALALVLPAGIGELAQAVVEAAEAEHAYLSGTYDPNSLRDLELYAARHEAEAALATRLTALGIAPAHARTMAEALS